MVTVFLLLGSNLGDRQKLLQQAVELIGQDVAPVLQQSSVYETQSWGKTDLPDYLNQVITLQTDIPAQEILKRTMAIEHLIGRTRNEKWGSRVIDIDILFYGDKIIEEPNLTVPHPQLHNRRFTLEPLAELAPALIHPLLNKSVIVIKNELKDNLIVKKLYF